MIYKEQTREQALGFYMELEAYGSQIRGALWHLQQGQMEMNRPLTEEMTARAEGKPFQRPSEFDRGMRASVSGMVSGAMLQLSFALDSVLEAQDACAEVAPDCHKTQAVN